MRAVKGQLKADQSGNTEPGSLCVAGKCGSFLGRDAGLSGAMRFVFALFLLFSSVAAQPGAAQTTGICQRGGPACAPIRARQVLDAAAAPWRAVGRVNFATIDVRLHCTGALVAENVVLTAAHCLYNGPRQRWIPAQSIQFVAGYQRSSYAARSAVARYILDPVQDVAGQQLGMDVPHDWALLILEEPIGASLGFFALAGEGQQTDAPRMPGYAGLRPHVLSLASDCGAAVPWEGGALFAYRCAAMPGDSGAPLLADGKIVAVMSALVGSEDGIVAVAIPVAKPADVLRQFLAE